MSEGASRATETAQRLVLGRVDWDEAVAQLLGVDVGQDALQEAAAFVGQRAGNGFPAAPMHRLLLAAAGEPVAVPTEEVAKIEGRQRQLLEQPPDDTFQLLAERAPELRDLERRAGTDPKTFVHELTDFERSFDGPTGPGAAESFRIALGIRRAVNEVVGPFSGHSDPVASSPWAEDPVTRYLWRVAGIDPKAWGPRPH